jgi:hypothetical protein
MELFREFPRWSSMMFQRMIAGGRFLPPENGGRFQSRPSNFLHL